MSNDNGPPLCLVPMQALYCRSWPCSLIVYDLVRIQHEEATIRQPSYLDYRQREKSNMSAQRALWLDAAAPMGPKYFAIWWTGDENSDTFGPASQTWCRFLTRCHTHDFEQTGARTSITHGCVWAYVNRFDMFRQVGVIVIGRLSAAAARLAMALG
jgi:hypothetical protein